MKKILLSIGICLFGTGILSAQQNEIFLKDNAAIGGYDAVAYFKENKPVKGLAEFSVSYKGANWLFASKTNADLFKATPEKYDTAPMDVHKGIKPKQVLMHGQLLMANCT